MSIMGNVAAGDADNVSDKSSFDSRQSNSIHYWSPAWHGLSVRVTHGVNEEKPASGATHATLGYDYTLSKRSSVYAYVTRLDNGANGVYDFAINSVGATPGATLKAVVLGMRHGF
jgi:predicted porin